MGRQSHIDWSDARNMLLKEIRDTGSCPNISENELLYNWLAYQKQLYKKGKLTAKHVDSLKSIDKDIFSTTPKELGRNVFFRMYTNENMGDLMELSLSSEDAYKEFISACRKEGITYVSDICHELYKNKNYAVAKLLKKHKVSQKVVIEHWLKATGIDITVPDLWLVNFFETGDHDRFPKVYFNLYRNCQSSSHLRTLCRNAESYLKPRLSALSELEKSIITTLSRGGTLESIIRDTKLQRQEIESKIITEAYKRCKAL